MHLSEDDAALFFKIWIGLLNYVNDKYKIAFRIGKITKNISFRPGKLVAIRSKLWENKEVISEYVEKSADTLTKREINILKSWEAYEISGIFAIMKHMKAYSVFMTHGENPKLYGVSGITDSIGEKIPASMLPILTEAVLLPFEGKIIYDSLLIPYDMRLGSDISMEMERTYHELKKKDGIIVHLPPADVHLQKSQKNKKSRNPQNDEEISWIPKHITMKTNICSQIKKS